MKILIIGLGNFGAALAVELTDTGNEVIAVDKTMAKVELLRDKVAHVVCMDSTNELAYDSLPIKDTDISVVAIGENEGAAIITAAILKKLGASRIIGRSLSPIHDTVLRAMGIEQIVHPEQESAEHLTRKINFKNAIDSFEVDIDYSISEVPVPPALVGKTIVETNFRQTHDLTIITILRPHQRTNFIGQKTTYRKSIGLPEASTSLEKGDILVVFGRNNAIQDFCGDRT